MKPRLDELRSRIMTCVRSNGNKSTELKFINILKKNSIYGWRRHQDVFGKPDFTFSKKRVAVFIDGCFWHGCSKHCRMPATNVKYWMNKIKINVERDKYVCRELKKKGWVVMRFWEHDLAECKTLNRKLNCLKSLVS